MKKTALILVATFISFTVLSQNRNELKGPAAKNYKPWKNKVTSVEIYSNVSDADLKGPVAKNFKPWKRDKIDDSQKKSVALKAQKTKLQGPAAKNYKPWMNRPESINLTDTQ